MAGKTYISIYLATILRTTGAIVLEFYCDSKDNKRNTASAVVRGLMFCLLSQDPSVSTHMESNLGGAGKLRDDSFEALWELLLRMAKFSKRPMFCILDGLDECDNDTDRLVQSITELLDDNVFNDFPFKMFVTSRPSLTGSRIPDQFARLSLGRNADGRSNPTESDVKRFIGNEFSKHFSPERVATQMMINYATAKSWCKEVEEAILEKAEGTFLWVGFAMRQIRRARPPDVKRILQGLPKGLDAMYARIVDQIQEDQKKQEHIFAMIRYALAAFRPLSTGEMAVLVDPRVDDPYFSKESIIRDCIEDSRGLLAVMDPYGTWNDMTSRSLPIGDVIIFVHQSVKDYLLSGRPGVNSKFPPYNMELLHKELAEACVGYLEQCLTTFGTCQHIEGKLTRAYKEVYRRGCESSKVNQLYTATSFLSYAYDEWPEHARHCQDASLYQMAFFAKDSLAFNSWLELWPSSPGSVSFYSSSTLLHVAAAFDLPSLVHHVLLVHGTEPHCRIKSQAALLDAKDECGLTPLKMAILVDNDTMAMLLLRYGASIESRDEQGITPLSFAATGGHEVLAKLQIENGAAVDSHDYAGRTPLSRAAEDGYEAIAKLLIENGASVYSKDNKGRTPPSHAVKSHTEEVARLLIKSGALIDSRDNEGRTPLAYAAFYERTAKLLIENGASVESCKFFSDHHRKHVIRILDRIVAGQCFEPGYSNSESR